MEKVNNDRQTGGGRIPVRFVDEDGARGDAPGDADAGDLGRESAYEDETDMQRRIDRNGDDAGEGDTAGGPAHSDLPEQREDQDTNPRATAAGTDDEVMRDTSTIEDEEAVEIDGSASLLSLQTDLLDAQGEVQALTAELEKVRAERQDLRELLARRQADFENSRKRMERERNDTYQRVVADLVGQLLPVIDNLRRALDAESSVEAGESEEFRHFLHGVELIDKQLNAVLERLGVEPVSAVGQPFDPHVHEAIATEQTEEFAPDTVVQEVRRGYRLGDRLIRPALVKVATKQ
jgi:molecular chaperone GrpE